MSEPAIILNDYLQSLYGLGILPLEEEQRLAYRIQDGDAQALNILITHNLRFVVYIVSKMTAWQYGNIPLEDLISMGNEQLLIAAKRWVPLNNARFATYARSFIERGVKRELDNTSNLIRLPVGIMEQVKRMHFNERALTQALGRKPKLSELAEKLGTDEEKIRLLQSYLIREPVSLDHITDDKFLEDFEE